MHIPDGYLGPKTCAAFYAPMALLWYVALKKAGKALRLEQMPLLSFSSALLFIVMMLNFPLPGGATAHVAGGALAAIIFGPWVALLSMSLVLFLQAVLFGDGGVVSYGANAFNMAFLISFSGYYIYVGLKRLAGERIASFTAAYVAVNIAALAVSAELGAQPVLESGPGGVPLYAPYPFSVTIPALMIPHLFVVGPLEGFATALIVSYITRTNETLLFRPGMASLKPLWIALAVLIAVTPLGLLASGTAWGEWGKDEVQALIGYVPSGMARLEGLWSGLLPDYGIKGLPPGAGYIISALFGSALAVFIIYAFGRLRGRPWRK